MKYDYESMNADEWIKLLRYEEIGDGLIRQRFPTDEMRNEYLSSIGDRDEEEVVFLIKNFLVHQGVTPQDHVAYVFLQHLRDNDQYQYEKALEHSYYKRILLHFECDEPMSPWEGNTWVLDLLPHHPKLALQGLEAYSHAHLWLLSDDRIWGFDDATQLIRAKFIGLPGSHADTIRMLQDLHWRQFECLVERLYNSMGYETELTTPTNDGGRDVIARRQSPGTKEVILADCKLWNYPVPVGEVRTILGTMTDARATKGVIVTTNSFTEDARELADRNPVELIDGNNLVPLMNEYLGSRWPLLIEVLVREAEKNGVHPPAA